MKRFLADNWPTSTEMHSWMRSFGADIEYTTVNMWFRRDSIPSAWLPTVLVWLEITRGEPISLLPWYRA